MRCAPAGIQSLRVSPHIILETIDYIESMIGAKVSLQSSSLTIRCGPVTFELFVVLPVNVAASE